MEDVLAKRLRLGDIQALEEIMDRYSAYAAKIIAVFLNRTLPLEDMEEVLSDVFISLWNSRSRLEGDVKPYLAAIARNAARQKLRQFRPVEEMPEDLELTDSTPGPERRAEDGEQAGELRAAIRRLAPADQELFFRFYFLDQTVGEIAAVTGQNPATLRSRLKRGREKLKKILTERGVCCD